MTSSKLTFISDRNPSVCHVQNISFIKLRHTARFCVIYHWINRKIYNLIPLKIQKIKFDQEILVYIMLLLQGKELIYVRFYCIKNVYSFLTYIQSRPEVGLIVANPGFPVVGGTHLVGGRRLPTRLHFKKFVCRNERIWTLDPPMVKKFANW